MSQGKLCGAEIELSIELHQPSVITVKCDKYHGHDGDHGKTFYHVVPRKEDPVFPRNYRVGNVQWNDNKFKD